MGLLEFFLTNRPDFVQIAHERRLASVVAGEMQDQLYRASPTMRRLLKARQEVQAPDASQDPKA
jgi:hypothetical protein